MDTVHRRVSAASAIRGRPPGRVAIAPRGHHVRITKLIGTLGRADRAVKVRPGTLLRRITATGRVARMPREPAIRAESGCRRRPRSDRVLGSSQGRPARACREDDRGRRGPARAGSRPWTEERRSVGDCWVDRARRELLARRARGFVGLSRRRIAGRRADGPGRPGLLAPASERRGPTVGPDDRRSAATAAGWLAGIQREDGSLPAAPGPAMPGWATPYALLLWGRLGGFEDQRRRARDWLTRARRPGADAHRRRAARRSATTRP